MAEPVLCPTMGWTISEWQTAYQQEQTPTDLLTSLLDAIRGQEMFDGALRFGSPWISLASDEQLQQQLTQLQKRLDAVGGDVSQLPLYGVPFAVKDNIDVKGFATTAACAEFAYEPEEDAFAVAQLRAAGAIVVGKTNLDQFATGLVGTRSPYGAVANPFNSEYISGGSSAGSAVSVSTGFVPFSLGTDTAGSGRVPAGFNHLVGLKPTRGMISNSGVVPACRSLDCISVFALNSDDAAWVYDVLAQYDEHDAYARPASATINKHVRVLGIPQDPEWFGDTQQQQAFAKACTHARQLGYEIRTIDFTPMLELARLLYQGPWVAERFAAVGDVIQKLQSQANGIEALDPVVAEIIGNGNNGTAVDAFKAEYKRQELSRTINAKLAQVDAFMVPTTPCFPTSQQVAAEPIEVNSRLGMYTNFVNLADLCALAIPAPMRDDGLPFGITLIAPSFCDSALLQFANHWQNALRLSSAPSLLGARQDQSITVAVVGAHLTGMPLNHQLTSRNARLLEQTHTAEKYQLYALANTTPPKPGLVRVDNEQSGHSIIVELWRLDLAAFGSFVNEIPQPLGIGTLELMNGRLVKGFICEPTALSSATDISHFGGWRAYIAQR